MKLKARELQFGLRIFLLVLLCILPSYEIVKMRFTNTVITAEEPEEMEKVQKEEQTDTTPLWLSEGDVIRQEVYVGEGTHLKELAVWIESQLEADEAGVVLTISQGDISQSEYLPKASIPANGLYEIKTIDFSAYSGGTIVLEIMPQELYGGSFAVHLVPEIIYGYEKAEKNGVQQAKSMYISFSGWSLQNEGALYSVVWIAVIFILVLLTAWLLTYKSEWKYFYRAIRMLVFGLIISIFSLLYPSFMWYGCDWCEGIFYYKKIQENSLFEVIFSSDFDLYMAQYNNIFMYLFVKVLGIDTYTFVACQLLSIGMIAYWASLFCKQQYGRYFSMDFRIGAAIVSICYLYTMQEFSFIGAAYFGILLLLYVITYDFSEDRLSFWLSIGMMLIICLSKMTFVLFCPIALGLLVLWREKLSRRNRILLWVMGITCLAEGVVSVILNGGFSGGPALGNIQQVSLWTLITGALYYTIQLANSVVFHEMSLANALLINVFMFAILAGMFVWCAREVIRKRRFEKAAGFMLAMLAVVYGNCALQMLTNSYSMTPGNIRWDEIFYIAVVNKWWWYAFGYVALWAIAITWFYIIITYCKENILLHGETGRSWYQYGKIILPLLICIVTVNQYAYHDVDLQSYKAANMFTMPSMMQGNFAEYSFMQKDEQFLILTSFEPNGVDWFYIEDLTYRYVELEERCHEIDLGEKGVGFTRNMGFPALYVHKDSFTNQMMDGAYVMHLYDADGEKIGSYKQIDTDLHREYICFYFDGEIVDNVGRAVFEYEDGTPAYIDVCFRTGNSITGE